MRNEIYVKVVRLGPSTNSVIVGVITTLCQYPPPHDSLVGFQGLSNLQPETGKGCKHTTSGRELLCVEPQTTTRFELRCCDAASVIQ